MRASKVINFVRRDSEFTFLFHFLSFSFLPFTDSPHSTLYTPLRCSCNFNTGNCDVHGTTIGADCSSDNQFFCTQTSARQPLACDAVTQTCQPSGPVPSARARSRRTIAGASALLRNEAASKLNSSSSCEKRVFESSINIPTEPNFSYIQLPLTHSLALSAPRFSRRVPSSPNFLLHRSHLLRHFLFEIQHSAKRTAISVPSRSTADLNSSRAANGRVKIVTVSSEYLRFERRRRR